MICVRQLPLNAASTCYQPLFHLFSCYESRETRCPVGHREPAMHVDFRAPLGVGPGRSCPAQLSGSQTEACVTADGGAPPPVSDSAPQGWGLKNVHF